MSLINQMLKDLESRRASGDLAQRAIDGMGAAGRKRQKQNVLLLTLVAVIAVLASVSAYLLWQERQVPAQSATTVAMKPAPAPSAPPAPPAVPAAPEEKAVAPLVQKSAPAKSVVRETPAGITRPEIEDEPADEQRVVAQQPVAVPRESPQPRIKKTLRPQSSEKLAEQQYQRGYGLLQSGDRKGAEEAWREALRIDAKHTASRESLAILYLSQSRRIEAAAQLQQGLALNPGNHRLALLYARMQLDAEDITGAALTLENAMAAQAQGADFYAFTAAVYQRQGDFNKSISAYQAALRQQPGQAVWWMGLGISLEGAGKLKEALTAYTEANKSGRLSTKLTQYVAERIKALE